MIRSWRRWMPTLLAGALAAGGTASAAVASTATATLPPAPYIHLRVTQSHNSAGNTVVSVWLSTNGGRALNTPTGSYGWPLVFTQPWHSACQASPRYPLPGGKTQLVYSSKRTVYLNIWQPVVSFTTGHAQQLTVCGYVITAPLPETPFSVVATTRTSVACCPPADGQRSRSIKARGVGVLPIAPISCSESSPTAGSPVAVPLPRRSPTPGLPSGAPSTTSASTGANGGAHLQARRYS